MIELLKLDEYTAIRVYQNNALKKRVQYEDKGQIFTEICPFTQLITNLISVFTIHATFRKLLPFPKYLHLVSLF